MVNYFKVKEQINCGSCSGSNDIMLPMCSYCGANFHITDPSAGVLFTREKADTFFARSDFERAKVVILQNQSNDVIIRFRLIIVELNDILISDSTIDPHKFKTNLDKLWDVMATSEGYYTAYSRYIYSILPYRQTMLNLESYRTIMEHGLIQQYEASGPLADAVRLQFAVYTLDEEMIKDIKFYKDPANQIDDPSFIKKKEYVLKQLQEALPNF